MPFTWTLDSSHTITGSIDRSSHITVNDAATDVYLTQFNNDKIYEWDGTTLTDLDFDTFAAGDVASPQLVDVQWFKSTLYVAYNDDAGTAAYIAKWNGGTSWSRVTELKHEDLISRSFQTASLFHQKGRYLQADDVRMITVTGNNFQTRLFATTDGTTWTLQTEGGAGVYAVGYYYMAGQDFIRTRGLVNGEAQGSGPYSNWREIEHNTGVEWDLLSASNHTEHFFGFLDGKSFYQDGLVMKYSTDWGVTLNSAGGPTVASTDRWAGPYDLHPDVQLLAEDGGTDVYVWNSNTNNWDMDSTIADDVFGFFVINDELFAICDGGGGGLQFYSGGVLTPPSGDGRLWIYKTNDKGLTWTSRGVKT